MGNPLLSRIRVFLPSGAYVVSEYQEKNTGNGNTFLTFRLPPYVSDKDGLFCIAVTERVTEDYYENPKLQSDISAKFDTFVEKQILEYQRRIDESGNVFPKTEIAVFKSEQYKTR